MNEKRIISLLPAATDIVCALGLEKNLVGRSHECELPDTATEIPVCSGSKVDSNSSSGYIDRQVKQALKDALSIYSVDADVVRELAPTTIITQAQCEVCAVSLNDVQRSLQQDLGQDVELLSLNPNSVQDIFDSILQIGNILDAGRRAEELVDELNERCELISHKLKFVGERPRVVCVEWLDPLMTAGNWTPEVIELAGGVPVLAEKHLRSEYVTFEEIHNADPDIIVIAPCGFKLERTLQELNLLFNYEGWSELSAVKNNQVFIADGNQYFNRSSQKVIDTVELLSEIIHPKQFFFGYEGSAWLKFST